MQTYNILIIPFLFQSSQWVRVSKFQLSKICSFDNKINIQRVFWLFIKGKSKCVNLMRDFETIQDFTCFFPNCALGRGGSSDYN